MNNLVYVGSLCPGEEFFYKGKHYRVYGHMIRNGIECVACYVPQNSTRTLVFMDLWVRGVRFGKSHGSH